MGDTTGRVLHRAAGYDFLVWLITGGRERRFRDRLVALARVQSGDSVLDVGCGTGSLAIVAKQRVGPTGQVHGIDASPEMVSRASRKARKRGTDVTFQEAIAEALPFPDDQFDVVLSTVMLHHLPRPARAACMREMRRVAKPGGRVLLVDFAAPSREHRGLMSHFHRHGHTKPEDLVALLTATDLERIDSGVVGMNDLHFVLAIRPLEGGG
jgi:ubiquinone/menaquinone biosynthesis C-methylase UbiE